MKNIVNSSLIQTSRKLRTIGPRMKGKGKQTYYAFARISKACPRLIVLILFIATVLRLVAINQSYWLDEAIGAIVVRNHTLAEILLQFPRGDNHPPLYYLMIKLWSELFGDGEVALRSLSVIFGVLTVYALYLITKTTGVFKRRYVFLPAILLATSPLHIYYSQEARMYPVTAFFATAAVYNFIKTLGKNGEKNWIWFSLFILSIAATDYVPIFLLPVFWLYALLFKRDKRWLLSFAAAHIPLFIFSLLWLPIFMHQSGQGAWLLQTLPAWGDLAGGASFKQAALMWNKFVLGRITFFNKELYYLLIVAASIPYIIVFARSLLKIKENIIYFLWLIVPTAGVFTASFFVPAFIYFRMIFVLPAFYLIAVLGAAQLKGKTKVAVTTLLLAINVCGWILYIANPHQQREQWRQAVLFIESKAEYDDVVIFTNPQPFAPWEYYSKGSVEAYGGTDSISATAETAKKTTDITTGKNGVFYFDYLSDLADPSGHTINALKDNGFEETSIFAFIGVGHVRYWVRN